MAHSRKPKKKILSTNVKMIAGAYLLVLLIVYVNQRDMMYYPSIVESHQASDYHFDLETIQTRTSDGLVLKHWFRPPVKDSYPVVVFFHGNGGHIGKYGGVIKAVLDAGYGLLAVEYRGYGENKGDISEQSLYSDAHSAMKWLLNRGYTRRDIFIMGLSLGSGVATEMAQIYDISGLILVAPFYSALSLAQDKYWYLPVFLLMKDRFENDLKIPYIKTPLLIVHGTEDKVIPMQQSQKLFDAAIAPKAYVEIKGAGHNDLFAHGAFDAIDDFIQSEYHTADLPAPYQTQP